MLVLYVGAAEGYHIKKMIEMFPEIKFDLWDPLRFSIKDTSQIKIFNKFFTDDDVRKYAENNKNLLFISDIRNAPQNLSAKDRNYDSEFEKVVNEDMTRQLKWVNMLDPVAISLKFRLPFVGNMKYLTGDVWLQSYSPASTEMRLFSSRGNYKKMINYDCEDVDGRLAYFNYGIRCNGSAKWEKIMKKYKIKNNWDNCYCFDILAYYLKSQNKLVSQKTVASLFMNILDFLKKRYGNKYDILFEK